MKGRRGAIKAGGAHSDPTQRAEGAQGSDRRRASRPYHWRHGSIETVPTSSPRPILPRRCAPPVSWTLYRTLLPHMPLLRQVQWVLLAQEHACVRAATQACIRRKHTLPAATERERERAVRDQTCRLQTCARRCAQQTTCSGARRRVAASKCGWGLRGSLRDSNSQAAHPPPSLSPTLIPATTHRACTTATATAVVARARGDTRRGHVSG